MSNITVTLPRSFSRNDNLRLYASDVQDLFKQLEKIDQYLFNTFFHVQNRQIRPKAFVSLFVNNEQVFDHYRVFLDGDHLTFAVAIAGG